MRLIVFESTNTERDRMFVQELPNGELRVYILPNKKDSLVSSIYYPNWNEIDEKNAESNAIKAKAAMISAQNKGGKGDDDTTVEEIISQNINKGGKKDDKKKKIYSF